MNFSLQPLAFEKWRRWMGIEPTWDFVEPHTGFEDQERHQVAPHLRAKNSLCRVTGAFGQIRTRVSIEKARNQTNFAGGSSIQPSAFVLLCHFFNLCVQFIHRKSFRHDAVVGVGQD